MNKKNMKVWVLGVPGVLILIMIILDLYSVDSSILPEYIWQIIAFLSLSLIFLSLLTYWAKDELFLAWFNFAKWFVPIIIVTTLFLENAGGGGALGMNKDFTVFILGILYTVFIVTSLVKIVRAYMKTRG